MSYQPYAIALTAGQKSSIKSAVQNKKACTLRISASQIGSGEPSIKLTANQINKLNKAKAAGKGCDITLSTTQLSQQGGFLQFLLPVLGSVASSLLGKITGNGIGSATLANQQIVDIKKAANPTKVNLNGIYVPQVVTKVSKPKIAPDVVARAQNLAEKTAVQKIKTQAMKASKSNSADFESAPVLDADISGKGMRLLGTGQKTTKRIIGSNIVVKKKTS